MLIFGEAVVQRPLSYPSLAEGVLGEWSRYGNALPYSRGRLGGERSNPLPYGRGSLWAWLVG